MVDEDLRPYRGIFGRAGIRAVQSTPLISTNGALVGILSTHFPLPHRPTDIEMRELQRPARLAAYTVIHFRAQDRSSSDAIKESLMLIQQSHVIMAFADGLLANVDKPRRWSLAGRCREAVFGSPDWPDLVLSTTATGWPATCLARSITRPRELMADAKRMPHVTAAQVQARPVSSATAPVR